jgi:hypothetical protein
MRRCGITLREKLRKAFGSFMSLGFIVLGVFTLVPFEASKVNGLGYYSICSYSPTSTVILIALAVFSIGICVRALYVPRYRLENEDMHACMQTAFLNSTLSIGIVIPAPLAEA